LTVTPFNDWPLGMCIDMGVGMLEIAGSQLNDSLLLEERLIDIDSDGVTVSPYCRPPYDCVCLPNWRLITLKRSYVEFTRRDTFRNGHPLTVDDVYLVISLQNGQLSSRELTSGETLPKTVKRD